MKNKLTRMLTAVALVAGMYGTTLAGAHVPFEVHIDTQNNSATGSLGSAYNSADSTQYIGCYLVSWPGYTLGVCLAVDANGESGSCVANNDPTMIATIAAMDAGSSLGFGWDKNGACTSLQVEHFSMYEPKQ